MTESTGTAGSQNPDDTTPDTNIDPQATDQAQAVDTLDDETGSDNNSPSAELSRLETLERHGQLTNASDINLLAELRGEEVQTTAPVTYANIQDEVSKLSPEEQASLLAELQRHNATGETNGQTVS